ncbi:MAG TPA: Ig-like domain-containing protein [Gemmatimonadales bacterium]|nr:Ig-like domain-containing protein [Gemmatimonadales bacterium]
MARRPGWWGVPILTLSLACGVGGGTSASDGTPPLISIDAPAPNAQVGGTVSIDATVVDDFGVDQVKILVDEVVIATLFTPPFHAAWNTAAAANNSAHVIRIEAKDLSGNTSTKSVGVTVVRGTQ